MVSQLIIKVQYFLLSTGAELLLLVAFGTAVLATGLELVGLVEAGFETTDCVLLDGAAEEELAAEAALLSG